MMLLYGFFRGISALLRRVAEWKHKRMQRAYEAAEIFFGKLESSCKADEVLMGRPADYAQQLKLLKAFERREATRQRWVLAAEQLNGRKTVEERVRRFREMRLPYTFGLIDMAFIMRMLDHMGILPHVERPFFDTIYTVLLTG